MKKITLTILCSICLGVVFAQDKEDTTSSATPPKSYGKISISYLNNSVFNGRKDSAITPYITPTIGYYDKSGFFITGALSYLSSAATSRIDLFNIEAGYDFNISKLDGEVTAFKSFYNTNSTNVKSEVSGGFAGSFGYDLGFIHPTLMGGINLGKSTDYTAAFSLDHSFYAADDKLEIVPSFLVNASTQHYYGNYYANRKYAKLKKKNGTGIYYDITADLTDASRFKILDYELSMPINYTVNKFTFGLTPAYALPIDPATVTVNLKPSIGNNTISKTFTEKLENSFFFTFEVSYKF
jgi:hypothetical protein